MSGGILSRAHFRAWGISMTRNAFVAAAAALVAVSCGQGAVQPASSNNDVNKANEGFALVAPASGVTWFCQFNQQFFAFRFHVELIGYSNFEHLEMDLEATTFATPGDPPMGPL